MYLFSDFPCFVTELSFFGLSPRIRIYIIPFSYCPFVHFFLLFCRFVSCLFFSFCLLSQAYNGHLDTLEWLQSRGIVSSVVDLQGNYRMILFSIAITALLTMMISCIITRGDQQLTTLPTNPPPTTCSMYSMYHKCTSSHHFIHISGQTAVHVACRRCEPEVLLYFHRVMGLTQVHDMI